ncbi:MAG: hypothetical protein IIA66_14390 [Planctomycetes bacterium]|nr:hypothetical protein [Planctomycetota bacterium]
MAWVKCEQCKKGVPTGIRECPFCGTAAPSQSGARSRILWYSVILLLVVGLGGAGAFLIVDPSFVKSDFGTSWAARAKAEEWVRTRLQYPREAEFLMTGERSAKQQQDGSWIVKGEFTAMNAFGVNRRSSYECRLLLISANPTTWRNFGLATDLPGRAVRSRPMSRAVLDAMGKRSQGSKKKGQ